MPFPPQVAGVHIRLVLTMFFWGGTFVAGRVLAEELHPLTAASLRFILASTMLLTTLKIRYGTLPRLDKKQWGHDPAGPDRCLFLFIITPSLFHQSQTFLCSQLL